MVASSFEKCSVNGVTIEISVRCVPQVCNGGRRVDKLSLATDNSGVYLCNVLFCGVSVAKALQKISPFRVSLVSMFAIQLDVTVDLIMEFNTGFLVDWLLASTNWFQLPEIACKDRN